MKSTRKRPPPPPAPIVWPRADREALAAFDPSTKVCIMNCGPSRDDPRTDTERKYLCDECVTLINDNSKARYGTI